ncbi:WHG domain-containing protein [Streptomyces sp. A5-4]|uniref:WHG domain-containing protein n=1 Tax=Streptomyces sp. A5-4 TaxID=3384771 RepID=UPI003DA9F775
MRGVPLGFQQVTFAHPAQWVGLDNFRRLFDDPLFLTAWQNTGCFTLLALVFGFAAPFATAVVINELRHGRSYLRMTVYLPVMLPPIVTMLLWRWFYDPGPGLFNSVLEVLHLPAQQWLESESLAMVSLVLVSTWANMGSTTLIYLAALGGIPGDLYEAAELDGASIRQLLWHITIPQMRFILMITLLLQVIGTMQVFVAFRAAAEPGADVATLAHALRGWALDDPHRYLLVYGTPVPGYHAPDDVTAISTRIMTTLLDACGTSARDSPATALATHLADHRQWANGHQATPAVLHRALTVWTRLHGVLSLELAGHFTGMGFDPALLFAAELDELQAH